MPHWWNMLSEIADSADYKQLRVPPLIFKMERSAASTAATDTMTTRLISAGIGVVIALIVLFLHNTVLFPIAVGIVSFLLLLEFYHANLLFKYRLATIGGMLFALCYPMIAVDTAARFKPLLVIVCILCIFGEYIFRKTTLGMRSFFALVTGTILIPFAASTLVLLNRSHEQHGILYVVLALGGAWIADSGAYFVGNAFGKHKLCPTISPHKTIEGFAGGITTNIVFFVLFNLIYGAICTKQGTPITYSWVSTILLAVLCALLGTIGDLTASVLKRQLGIKDYGNIMPGHGGLLDRFDSVLLVAPFFCAYVTAFGFYNT